MNCSKNKGYGLKLFSIARKDSQFAQTFLKKYENLKHQLNISFKKYLNTLNA